MHVVLRSGQVMCRKADLHHLCLLIMDASQRGHPLPKLANACVFLCLAPPFCQVEQTLALTSLHMYKVTVENRLRVCRVNNRVHDRVYARHQVPVNIGLVKTVSAARFHTCVILLLTRRILRLSSLNSIFEGFLSACWSQREAGRSQRQAEARAACILEGQDDQLIDELRRLDSYIKEGRVEVEKWKDFALQSARNMSS